MTRTRVQDLTGLRKSERRFTGRDPAHDLNFAWIEVLHPDDRQQAKQDLIEASQTRRPCSGEYRVRRANGDFAWFHDVSVAYFNADGSYAGYIGTYVDMAEHRSQASAGQQIRESFVGGGLTVPLAATRTLE